MLNNEMIKATIEKHIDNNQIDLKQKLPHGSRIALAKLYNFSKDDVKDALSAIRGERNCRLYSSNANAIEKTVTSDFQTYCLNNELYRNSNNETPACDMIITAMKTQIILFGLKMKNMKDAATNNWPTSNTRLNPIALLR